MQFAAAIEWGEKGVDLKKQTNVDTVFGSEHNLALARRDAGEIEAALAHFLGEAELRATNRPKIRLRIGERPETRERGTLPPLARRHRPSVGPAIVNLFEHWRIQMTATGCRTKHTLGSGFQSAFL